MKGKRRLPLVLALLLLLTLLPARATGTDRANTLAAGGQAHSLAVQEDGTVVEKKYVDVKFTLDERIVDGFYYAAFFKHYRRILAHPEILDNPPEEVLSDID